MPPIAFPNPIPAWVKGAWHTVETTIVEPYASLLTYIENLSADMSWMHLSLKMHNTAPSAVVQDDMYVGFDILNITGGVPDHTWTTTDFTTCESAFDTWFNAYKAFMPDWLTLTEYRWYVKSFNPLTTSKPFAPHGPPIRITSRALTGTQSSYEAPQVAFTLTEKTPWSKHWGRVYMPYAGGAANVIAGGRANATNCTTAATQYETLNQTLAAADFQMVVPSVQIDKTPARQLLTITSVQVDDVLDVQRRRRARNPAVRAIKP